MYGWNLGLDQRNSRQVRFAQAGVIGALLIVITALANLSQAFDTDVPSMWKTASSHVYGVLNYRLPGYALMLVTAGLGTGAWIWRRRDGQVRNGHSNAPAELTAAVARGPLQTEGAFLNTFVQLVAEAQNEIAVCFLGKSWVFPLVFSIAEARRRGISVTVLVDGAKPHDRYRLLGLLGCRVLPQSTTARVPFAGVVVDAEDVHHGAALALSIKEKEGVFATVYQCPHEYYVVRAISAQIRDLANTATTVAPSVVHSPVFEPRPLEELFSGLSKSKAYRHAQFFVEEIRIADTRPIGSAVMAAKVYQAHRLIRFFQENRWPLFDLVGIKLSNGAYSLLVPPVLESRNGTLQVAEGHSRLFALRQLGVETVKAVVVRGVTTPPPAPETTWDNVSVSFDRPERNRPELARHIETNTHANVWPDLSIERF